MKAIILDSYGGSDRLRLVDRPEPSPEAGQVLFLMVRPRGTDLEFLGRLADEGRLRPSLALTLPLQRAGAAQDASQQGHARGKIVLELGS